MQKKEAGLSQKRGSTTSAPARQLYALAVAGLTLLLGAGAQAQGILTVTPGRAAATAAGTGVLGYTGDGSAATSATLATPAAVAYDASGNLFLADANNHVVREVVASSGNIITVAGTGVAGFGGDGGAAASAFLDTPTGIAVDASGNLYIADSHNQRIRKVTGTTITTIAGSGVAGYSGDSGAATSAALNLPSAVAVDSSGNIYIADTNNQRIRKITGTVIITIAGTGEQNFTGDGGAATSAALDSPTGVAVDASGNVFIADRHNHRIRELTGGNLSTVAGSGTPDFAGSFSGDGAMATAATLSKPTGVAVDAAGHVYITDTNNQRVRELGGGAITTILGTGEQGFAGDSGAATSAVLNAPRAAAADAVGNLAIADAPGERVRSALLPILSFGNGPVGVPSSAQTIMLSNTGTASLTVSSAVFTGAFAKGSGGSCSNTPITLAANASCTVQVLFVPPSAGTASGSITFSGAGVVPQTVLLTGNGVQVAATKLVYTSVPPTPITAGGNAGTVQVALEDSSGNVATSNSGTAVTLAVTGPSGYSQTYNASTTNGVATFNLSSIPMSVAGVYTYTAASGTLTSAVAMETVNPGAAVALTVNGPALYTAPQTSGMVPVTALDSYGNKATGFTGTVTLSSTDSKAAFSPASYMFTSSDMGSHTFTVTFNTGGTQILEASSSSLTGYQNGIIVEDAIWVLNANDGLVRLTSAGVQTTAVGPTTGNSSAGGLAIDAGGNVWATQTDQNAIVAFTAAGAAVSVPGNAAAGVNAPVALAIDGAGQVWIANGNATVSVLSAAGAAVTSPSGYQGGSLSAPSSIAIDSAGSVWIANQGDNSVTEIIGVAAPVTTPTVKAVARNALGTRP